MDKDIRLITFDLDGTLANANSWYLLNNAYGLSHEEDEELYRRYLEKEHDYHEWTHALSNLFQEKGKATRVVLEHVADALPLRKDALYVVQELGKKYKLAIISGAPDPLVSFIGKKLGIEKTKAATVISFSDEGFFISMKSLGDEDEGKAQLLKELSEETGIPYENIAHVGDSDNDKILFEKAGLPIIFGDKELSNRKDVLRIHTLTELLAIFPL